jgi:hypothetical protein
MYNGGFRLIDSSRVLTGAAGWRGTLESRKPRGLRGIQRLSAMLDVVDEAQKPAARCAAATATRASN